MAGAVLGLDRRPPTESESRSRAQALTTVRLRSARSELLSKEPVVTNQKAWFDPTSEPRLVVSGGSVTAGPYVLVVDDDRDLRGGVVELLADAGYRVVEAAHGGEALTLMRLEKPAFVVMDLMMPEMDGWELAEAMEADPTLRDVPFCAVSASTSLRRPPPPRAVCFIRKPYQ